MADDMALTAERDAALARIARLEAALRFAQEVLEQAMNYIHDETPEVGTVEEARDDTLWKIRDADRVAAAALTASCDAAQRLLDVSEHDFQRVVLENEALHTANERLRIAVGACETWAKALPISVIEKRFGDYCASAMEEIVASVKHIAREALTAKENPDEREYTREEMREACRINYNAGAGDGASFGRQLDAALPNADAHNDLVAKVARLRADVAAMALLGASLICANEASAQACKEDMPELYERYEQWRAIASRHAGAK